ncbi:hypothetical protein DBZ36_04800 [Alginatibacterium sediminis]|uniref:Extracellular solute-binding protein n=1 Tax=Alginatibacterium sediminis TaxID=2164068 RepID=A0A420EGJ1_9ALTE|nr:hypothetical protein [Alginatibacterium sediminis]RKF19780.1 hypothetical protein DBZ36_04800 [Alginatibacterium sediminis]
MLTLRGMTWDHPRGYAPLEQAALEYSKLHPEVNIIWERRSLQAFADRPIDVMAAEYDLMIIDHPHVGEITRKACLLKLDQVGRDQELAHLSRNSIGPSHQSYHYDGHQWALAIDAAAQIACSRPDLIDIAPRRWSEVIELAKTGKVLCPLKPVDAIDGFFSLCANLGNPVAQHEAQLVDPKTGSDCLRLLRELASHVPQMCLSANPIEIFEIMSQEDDFSYCPLMFGYTNYGRPNYRKHQLRFHDMPAIGDLGCKGSIIGGTGICISSLSKHQQAAIDFSFYLASESVQSGYYFEHQGQPAHKQAWLNPTINEQCNNFFKDTFETLEQSWVRPRYDGYMSLADDGGDLINNYLHKRVSTQQCLKQLEALYQYSLTHPASQKFE